MKKYSKKFKSPKIAEKEKGKLFGVFGRLNGKRAYIALSVLVFILLFSLAAKRLSLSQREMKTSFNSEAWNNAIGAMESEKQITDSYEDTISSYEEIEKPKKAGAEKTEFFEEQTAEKNEEEGEIQVATEVFAAEDAKIAEKTEVVFEKPSKGKVLKKFSGNELVFSETMNDWRTHNGIDYAAEIGDQVISVSDGVVSKVFKDDLMGIVVEINHQHGTTAMYANLQSLDFIKEGKQVKKGDIIGGVGECGGLEKKDGVHLHFEIRENGEYKNPEDYFSH